MDFAEMFEKVKLDEREKELETLQEIAALKLKFENEKMVFESKEYELIKTSCL